MPHRRERNWVKVGLLAAAMVAAASWSGCSLPAFRGADGGTDAAPPIGDGPGVSDAGGHDVATGDGAGPEDGTGDVADVPADLPADGSLDAPADLPEDTPNPSDGAVVLEGCPLQCPGSSPRIRGCICAYGDASDGSMVVQNGTTVGTTAIGGLNGGIGATSVTVDAGLVSLQPGDVVLLHQTRGGQPGVWELNLVAPAGVSGTTVTLVLPLQHNYTTDAGAKKAQMVRVPQLDTLTVQQGGTVAPQAWDGRSGGIVALFVATSATLDGAIDAGQAGFLGSSHACLYQCAPGGSGESSTTFGSPRPAANGTGGGGGTAGDCNGGGGGGHGTSGGGGDVGTATTCPQASAPASGGAGGGTAGGLDLRSTLFLGGAGGEGGGDADGAFPGKGGAGGGMAVLLVRSLTVSGTGQIDASGEDGGGMGGGGGGAGGSVLIFSDGATLGDGQVTALGGDKGTGTCSSNGDGGQGGDGRIAVVSTSVSGTTLPGLVQLQP
jgi:hypothetical protein